MADKICREHPDRLISSNSKNGLKLRLRVYPASFAFR